MHSVIKLSQRNADPHKEHEAGAKRVLPHLRGTAGVPIHCYVDADWAGDGPRTENPLLDGHVLLQDLPLRGTQRNNQWFL